MCLGATLWSGVKRMICGATRQDAEALQFDEGPVFPESYAYLEDRGIDIVHGVCRMEAVDVLNLYLKSNGVVYNG
jgi:tRNA(Arg) A34 adenosine deaminase TadA